MMLYIAGWCQLLSHTEELMWHWLTVVTYGKHIGVALTDSYHLWTKYWCGTDWGITCGKKYWCGTDWAINYGGENWCGTDCYHLWREKIFVALTDSCQLLKKILVWHWLTLTVITYGDYYFYWCGTDSYHLMTYGEKKIGVALADS